MARNHRFKRYKNNPPSYRASCHVLPLNIKCPDFPFQKMSNKSTSFMLEYISRCAAHETVECLCQVGLLRYQWVQNKEFMVFYSICFYYLPSILRVHQLLIIWLPNKLFVRLKWFFKQLLNWTAIYPFQKGI